MMTKETFTIKLTYEMSVNTDTGEILETKLIGRSIDNSDLKVSKKKEISSGDPTLFLEENKCRLNEAAVQLMNLTTDTRISIKYEQCSDGDRPILEVDDKNGNKLTKSNTIACRGNKNQELAKYGTEFEIVAHPNRPKTFILVTDKKVDKKGDENVNISPEDVLDLTSLIDDSEDIKEVDSDFFKL